MTGDAFRWVLLLLVVGVAGTLVHNKYEATRPCAQPISYALGAVDPRFNVSTEALIADTKLAADIWNKAEGKTVLTYDPTATFKINLVYDEREANAKMGSTIAQKQAEADTARVALDAADAKYARDQAAYNEKVNAANARGGATKAEIKAFSAEQSALLAASAELNTNIASYNARIRALNAQVAEFNQSAGHTFEEGRFTQDASGRRIDIFEFVGMTQLERVLAHEFGHALGLGHNDDASSIMYAQNESGNLTPTDADLSALKAICGK